jgi:hypothetical protein
LRGCIGHEPGSLLFREGDICRGNPMACTGRRDRTKVGIERVRLPSCLRAEGGPLPLQRCP